MFAKLYPIPKDCHRHEQGPFAKERATILAELDAKSYSLLTIRNYAKDLLRAANYIASDLECETYDDCRIERICKNSRSNYIKSFKTLAEVLGKYKNDVCFSDDKFAKIAESFLDSKTNTLAEETLKSYRYFLRKLCRFFAEHKIEISSLHCSDIDDFLETCKSLNPHTKRLIYSRIIVFLKFCEKNDLRNEENYKYVMDRIDATSLMDWYICRAYYADMDLANVKFFQSDEGDGKWHWCFFDLDWALWNNTEDPIGRTARNDGNHAIILALLKNPEFKDIFLKRYAFPGGKSTRKRTPGPRPRAGKAGTAD